MGREVAGGRLAGLSGIPHRLSVGSLGRGNVDSGVDVAVRPLLRRGSSVLLERRGDGVDGVQVHAVRSRTSASMRARNRAASSSTSCQAVAVSYAFATSVGEALARQSR